MARGAAGASRRRRVRRPPGRCGARTRRAGLGPAPVGRKCRRPRLARARPAGSPPPTSARELRASPPRTSTFRRNSPSDVHFGPRIPGPGRAGVARATLEPWFSRPQRARNSAPPDIGPGVVRSGRRSPSSCAQVPLERPPPAVPDARRMGPALLPPGPPSRGERPRPPRSGRPRSERKERRSPSGLAAISRRLPGWAPGRPRPDRRAAPPASRRRGSPAPAAPASPTARGGPGWCRRGSWCAGCP